MNQLIRPLIEGEIIQAGDIWFDPATCKTRVTKYADSKFESGLFFQHFRPVTIPPYEEFDKFHFERCTATGDRCGDDLSCEECAYNSFIAMTGITKAEPTMPVKKEVSLKHMNATVVYWVLIGLITVGYFFFITCVK